LADDDDWVSLPRVPCPDTEEEEIVKHRNMTGVLVGLVVLLAACQPSASPAGGAESLAPSEAATEAASTAPSEAASTSPGASGVTLTIAETPAGAALAGQGGLTLYILTDEADGTIHCVDDCATNWPPLTGTVNAGDADASLLGTIDRPDGSVQATYDGFPLYYFAGDQAPGDSNGEGLGGVWFIADPAGNM
jgi:predicted lipoprotein with Yx(FWY)xxD motif